MTPFVEQIDPRLEAAARVFGAGTFRVFVHVLVPLLTPGILAAGLLVLVRTIAMFELTFLTAGPDSQTLNDATALVAYRFAIAAMMSGRFSLYEASLRFCFSRTGRHGDWVVCRLACCQSPAAS